MNSLRIMLVKPYYPLGSEIKTKRKDNLFNESVMIAKNNSVDLIVFPEDTFFVHRSEEMNRFLIDRKPPIAIIAGFRVLSNKSSWATFYNPNKLNGDTEIKKYCKHTTAITTAFDLSLYKSIHQKEFFSPIIFKGIKVQVSICHDIFYPLLFEKFYREGMDFFINISGYNVKPKKWYNVHQGRSYETSIPIFCTMKYSPNETGTALSFCFYKGNKILPLKVIGDNINKKHEYTIFDTSNMMIDKAYFNEQEESTKSYNEFFIGLNKYNISNDINLFYKKNIYVLDKSTKEKININELWYKYYEKSVAIRAFTIDKLIDRSLLQKINYPRGYSKFIIVYYSISPVNDKKKVLSLIKLRVIENRVAILLIYPNYKVLVKRTNHKDIQLFNIKNEVIGLDLTNTENFHSIFKEKDQRGIYKRNKNEYLSLI